MPDDTNLGFRYPFAAYARPILECGSVWKGNIDSPQVGKDDEEIHVHRLQYRRTLHFKRVPLMSKIQHNHSISSKRFSIWCVQ